MKILGIIILMFGLQLSTFGQNNPGYMGKHIVLSGEGTFSGSFLLNKIWLKYGGSIEITTKSNLSFGASFLYNKSIFPLGKNNHYSSDGGITFDVQNEKSIDKLFYTIPYGSGFLITKQFSFDLYRYSSGSIAPLGHFIRYSFFYISNKSDSLMYNLKTSKYGTYNKSTRHLPNKNYTYEDHNLGVQILIGRRRIIKNIIVITYGIKYGLVVLNPITNELGFGLNLSTSSMNEIINPFVYFDNSWSSFISLHFSIGLVL